MLEIVTAELQTANVAYFHREIQLSEFSAYPDGSPSQLIRQVEFYCIRDAIYETNKETTIYPSLATLEQF